MPTALRATLVFFLAIAGIVAVPAAVIVAYNLGVARSVLGVAIGGLLLGAFLIARAGKTERIGSKRASASAQWLAEARQAVVENQGRQSTPAFVGLLLIGTPVLQWAFLVSRSSGTTAVAAAAMCVVIGVAGMIGVALWNFRRGGPDPVLSILSAPWRVLALGVAGLLIMVFEAVVKHDALATLFVLLLGDIVLMRLMLACLRRLAPQRR